jgi:hypothetical protein
VTARDFRASDQWRAHRVMGMGPWRMRHGRQGRMRAPAPITPRFGPIPPRLQCLDAQALVHEAHDRRALAHLMSRRRL